MKTDTTDTSDCYGYMRLTHVLAVCWGLPITRRLTNDNGNHDKDTVIQGNINDNLQYFMECEIIKSQNKQDVLSITNMYLSIMTHIIYSYNILVLGFMSDV